MLYAGRSYNRQNTDQAAQQLDVESRNSRDFHIDQ